MVSKLNSLLITSKKQIVTVALISCTESRMDVFIFWGKGVHKHCL